LAYKRNTWHYIQQRQHRLARRRFEARETFFTMVTALIMFPWLVMLFLPKNMSMNKKKNIVTYVSIVYYAIIVLAVVAFFSTANTKPTPEYVDESVNGNVGDVLGKAKYFTQNPMMAGNIEDDLYQIAQDISLAKINIIYDKANDDVLIQDAQNVYDKYKKMTSLSNISTAAYNDLESAIGKLDKDMTRFEFDPQSR